jgi:hypothetical protein
LADAAVPGHLPVVAISQPSPALAAWFAANGGVGGAAFRTKVASFLTKPGVVRAIFCEMVTAHPKSFFDVHMTFVLIKAAFWFLHYFSEVQPEVPAARVIKTADLLAVFAVMRVVVDKPIGGGAAGAAQRRSSRAFRKDFLLLFRNARMALVHRVMRALAVFRHTGVYPRGVPQLYVQGGGGVPDRNAAEVALLAAGRADGGAVGMRRAANIVE